MRVYVVSAYPTVRAGLAALVRGQPGWSVLGEATPQTITRQASGMTPPAAGGPDVVLADLDGVAALETVDAMLTALAPARGIVALGSGAGDIERGRRGDESTRLLAGVARLAGERGLTFGALRRDASEEEIVASVAAAGSGLITLDPVLADLLYVPAERAPLPAANAEGTEPEPLTSRELEVLQLLAQGLPNKLIAQRLHISEHTAKFHVSAILMKLGAASRTEAVTSAARRGLLTL
jgi:DNA-binding NarL/FixJ family response regulator